MKTEMLMIESAKFHSNSVKFLGMVATGNTKEGSIIVLLTSCLTGLD
jgi:hypothetical protein